MLRFLGWFAACILPVSIIIAFYFPQYWEILLVNIIFYSKLVLKLAKAEVVLFISKMTVLKLLLLAVKRFVMDNIVSRAVSEHFMIHVKPEAQKWWKSLDMKGMLLWFIPASVLTVISTWFVGLANTTLFLFIKTLIIGFFKLLWLILAKVFLFFTNSIFAQILELLAISYLIDKISQTNIYIRYIKPCWRKIAHWLFHLTDFVETKIHKPINNKVDEIGAKAAQKFRHSRKSRQQNNCSKTGKPNPNKDDASS
jgi:hypothetical protein